MRKIMERCARGWGGAVAILILLALCWGAWAADSKYATHATLATVTFAEAPAGYVVRGLYAVSDKAGSVANFYTRKGKFVPTAVATNGATVIAIANTGSLAITNDNIVVYRHANGRLHQTTAASVTTTNVTLTAGIPIAGAAGDVVYGLQKTFVLPVGAGTLNPAGGWIYAVPADSPLYIEVDGTSAVSVAATTDR